MRRREFMSLSVGAAVSWPFSARAQQPALPIVGFLRSEPLGDAMHLVAAFRAGLKEAGFTEDQNVTIELRSAEGHADRLTALVGELIHRPVAVIVANSLAAVAAATATSRVPIVFATGIDPVRDHLVTSLNHPGGNVTGVIFFAGNLAAKRLELLRQLVPKAATIAVLVKPNTPETEAERRDGLAAAQATGQQLLLFDASTEPEIATAFKSAVERGAGALLVVPARSLTPSENISYQWLLVTRCQRCLTTPSRSRRAV